MNIRLIKLLAAACGILIVIIIAEWQYARYSKKQLLAKLEAETEHNYAPGELPHIELAQQAEDSYVELTSRPLFIEGRRPVPGSEDEAGQAIPMEKFDWQLDGVYIHQNTSVALFSRSPKKANQERHLKKSEGEVIDGWTLLEVKPDKVVLEQDGERHELMLRKPKPTKLPSQPKSEPMPNPVNPA
jgi:hypothetical protein